jgi:hypothetical protein
MPGTHTQTGVSQTWVCQTVGTCVAKKAWDLGLSDLEPAYNSYVLFMKLIQIPHNDTQHSEGLERYANFKLSLITWPRHKAMALTSYVLVLCSNRPALILDIKIQGGLSRRYINRWCSEYCRCLYTLVIRCQ